MKREYSPPSKWPLIIYRALVIALLAIIIVIIACTVYAFARPPDSADPQGEARYADGPHMFSDIRGLRIPIGNPPAATVIVSISFPYPPDDLRFAEEIGSRVEDLRSAAVGYFSSLSAEQLARFDENAAKTEILRRYNAILRLGTIETLYFYDLTIIE